MNRRLAVAATVAILASLVAGFWAAGPVHRPVSSALILGAERIDLQARAQSFGSASTPWIEEAPDPERLRAVMADNAFKLPDDFPKALAYPLPDGSIRVLFSVWERTPAIEGWIAQQALWIRWFSDTPSGVARIAPEGLVSLLESPAVAAIDPDVPISFQTARTSVSVGARSLANDPAAWRFDPVQGRPVPAYPGAERAFTGDGVTVAIVDTGIDPSVNEFGAWDCVPGSEGGCAQRIKASVRLDQLLGTDLEGAGFATTSEVPLSHGTHLAGVVGGNAFASRAAGPDPARYGSDGYVFGLAPNVSLVSVGLLQEGAYATGHATVDESVWLSMAVSGLTWIADHAQEHGIRVVLNGWACSANQVVNENANTIVGPVRNENPAACRTANTNSAFFEAVRRLYDLGITTVFPTGNQASGEGREFGFAGSAANPYSLAAGAYNATSLRLWPHSGRAASDLALPSPGQWFPQIELTGLRRPDLAAPGVDVWAASPLLGAADVFVPSNPGATALPSGAAAPPRSDPDYPYVPLSGTSIAAAHVAAAAAILVDACPGATPLHVMRALMAAADPALVQLSVADPATPRHEGYGALRVRDALAIVRQDPFCLVDPAPVARFDAPRLVAAGAPAAFRDDSRDNGTLASWQWSFGDGSTSAARDPTHVYSAPGTYTVALVVTDGSGARQRATRTIRVVGQYEASPPIVILRQEMFELYKSRGNGTPGNPFIIENRTIHYQESAAIRIEATDRATPSFVLRNISLIGTLPESGRSQTNLISAIVHIKDHTKVLLDAITIHAVSPELSANAALLIENSQVTARNITIQGCTSGLFLRRTPQAPPTLGPSRVEDLWVSYCGSAVQTEDAQVDLYRARLVSNGVGFIHRNAGGANLIRTRFFDSIFDRNAVPLELQGPGDVNAKSIWALNPPSAASRNIAGGARLGGNYWSDVVPIDADGDDFLLSAAEPFKIGRVEDPFPLHRTSRSVQGSLVADPAMPQRGEVVDLTAALNDPDGIIVGWMWDFGDGSRFATTNPVLGGSVSHAYAASGPHLVTLNAVDDSGRIASFSTLVLVNQRPVPAFSFQPNGLRVEFDASQSLDPEGLPLAYRWDFGDGSGPGTNGTERHTYANPGTYAVTLRVEDPLGGAATLTQEVLLASTRMVPVANFSLVPLAPTTANTIEFRDETIDNSAERIHAWDFGDGNTSILPNPTHRYARGGDYLVRLHVVDGDGDSDDVTRLIHVANLPPVAAFTFLPQTTLTRDPVQFIDASSDPEGPLTERLWDFGDGSTGSGTLPGHRYVANGVYTVTLRVRDLDGTVATSTRSISIGNTPPIAEFDANPLAALTHEAVTFTSRARDFEEPDGTGLIEESLTVWDFGDGTNHTGSRNPPPHVYTENGVYAVRLTVFDDDGANTTSLPKLILVGNRPPVAAFRALPVKPTTEDVVGFEDLTEDDGSVVGWAWEFGDGATSSLQHPRHRFPRPGLYQVNLTVTDEDGAQSQFNQSLPILAPLPQVNFSWSPAAPQSRSPVLFSDATRPNENITARHWDFGDGAQANGTQVAHNFSRRGTFRVALNVTDVYGNTASLARFIEVSNRPPVAAFAVSSARVGLNRSLNLTDASTDPDGTVARWDWDLGDGATATAATVQHAYQRKGVYTVRLTVFDDEGASSTTTRSILVENAAPNATLVASTLSPVALQEVQFRVNATDADGTIAQVAWDFGDGARAEGLTATHAFPRNGRFNVTARVTDDDESTFEVRATVTVGNAPPTAGFRIEPLDPLTGSPVTFSSDAKDPDGRIARTLWSFGDGNTSLLRSAVHRYPRPGTYPVQLTVQDDDGGVREVLRSLTVHNRAPVAKFTWRLEAEGVRFQDASSDRDGRIVERRWDFGDGGNGTGADLLHAFAPGGHLVVLHVRDDLGLEAGAFQVISVPETGRGGAYVGGDLGAGPTPDEGVTDPSGNASGAPALALLVLALVALAWRRGGSGARRRL